MSRFNPAKNSFVSGELSPRLEGRDDLNQYFQGMRQALNGIVLPHGGFMRRSGTQYIAEAKDSSKAVRLIPFIFGVTASYICEFGDQYVRFYVNEGQLVSGTAVEVSSPFTEAQLGDIQWAQSADVLWLVHPDHPPYKLRRTSATTFTLTEIEWREGHAPLRSENLDDNNLTVTGSGPYTLTWATSPIDTSSDSFLGRAVRHNDGTDEGWYKITAVTSSTVVTATLEGGTASTAGAGSTDWALGMFADDEGSRAVAFHEGRLWYGGSNMEPDRIVGSVSDDFDNFQLRDAAATDAENADKAISRRATGSSAGQVNAIQWLASARQTLNIGTAGNEAFLRGANQDTITPLGAVLLSGSSRGSTHDMPVVLGESVIFIQRNSRKLRELTYSIQSDSNVAEDMSILAEHILRDGSTEIVYQQDPDSVIWVVRGDGTLVGFTREQEQEIVGAHRQVFGGLWQSGQAVCESAAVIPSPDADQDQLWVAVKRTIDGSTVRYIELMADTFRPDVFSSSPKAEKVAALEEAFYVDSGLSLDSPLGGGITGVTNASPAVVTTSSAHGLSNGDRVRLRDIVGGLDSEGEDTLGDRLNHTSFIVAGATSTTINLTDLAGANIDTSGDTAYIKNGTVREEVNTVSGLDHLEGETIQVLVDGALHPDVTVSSGSITLDRRGSIIHAGLQFNTVGETQRFFGGGRFGGDQGQQMRIQRIVLRLHNTLGVKVGIGPDPDSLETPSGGLADPLFRLGDDTFDQSPPLFVAGDVEIGVPGGWTTEPTVYFRQDRPLPLTVLAIYPRMESEER